MTPPVAEGFVLVGGLSTRMGRDKALLRIGGRPLAIRQAEKLATICPRVSFVGKEDPVADPRFGFVRDASPEPAALHGIEAALAALAGRAALLARPGAAAWALVLAVDLPAVTGEFLAALLARAAASGRPAAAPLVGGHLQVLCSAWRTDALAAVRARISAGRLAVAGALEEAGALLLSEDEAAALPGGDASNFANLNTPEDHEAFQTARAEEEDRPS